LSYLQLGICSSPQSPCLQIPVSPTRPEIPEMATAPRRRRKGRGRCCRAGCFLVPFGASLKNKQTLGRVNDIEWGQVPVPRTTKSRKKQKAATTSFESWGKIADSNQQLWTCGLGALPHVSVTLPLRKPTSFSPFDSQQFICCKRSGSHIRLDNDTTKGNYSYKLKGKIFMSKSS